MSERVGQHLGNYRLLRVVGRGGFADVYLGEHIHLKSLAAIKVLFNRLADDLQEDFLKEARLLARLSHPHIIRILDFGISEGVPFLVMDYAPEGTLRKRHPRHTKLPVTTVVEYVEQIADGLQYAHDQKLIHRDLKPDNVLIGQRGELLLSDFGVALIAATTQVQNAETKLAGTALYMAPEQSRGKPLFASDQYALGIMVYEWLCGTRPFHGSLIELYSQHYFVPPAPLREHVPALSPEVERVVLRALAKNPDQRFASVKDFARALKQVGQSTQIMAAIDAVESISTQKQLAVSTPSLDNADMYRTISSQDTSDAYRTISSQDGADMYRTVLSQDDIAPVTSLADDANAAEDAQEAPLSNALDDVQTALLQEAPNDVQMASQPDYADVPLPASLLNRTSPLKWARLISLNVDGLHKKLARRKVSLLVGLTITMMLIFSVSLIYAAHLQSSWQTSSTIPTATSTLPATSYATGGGATSMPGRLTVTPETSRAKPVSTAGLLPVVNSTRGAATPKPTAKPTATPTPASVPATATPTPTPMPTPTPTPTPTPIPTAVIAAPSPIPVSVPATATPTPTPVLLTPQETPTPTPTP